MDSYKAEKVDVSSGDAGAVKGLAFKGGKALFLRHLSGFAVNFTGGIVLARLLGPEVLGLYFISYTVFVILRQFIDLGIGVHIIRLPSNPSPAEYKSAFTLQQAAALAACFFTAFVVSPSAASWYGHEEIGLLIASAAAGGYFSSWQSLPLSKLEREMDYKKVGLIEFVEVLVFNASAVILAWKGAGVAGLAVGNLLRGLVPALMALWLGGLTPGFSKDRASMASVIRGASPVLGINLSIWVIMAAPPVLVGKLSGPKALGIAQLAYSLMSSTMFVSSIFQRVGLTSLAKFQDDPVRFNKAVKGMVQLLFIIYIPLTMGVASLSPWWAPFIYGSEWAGMDGVILIAALPLTAVALLTVFLSALLSKGHASLVLKQSILHAVIYWTVMALTASSLGALSVPVTHTAAMTAGCLFIYGYSKYCGPFDYAPLAAGFLSGAAIMAISWFSAKAGYVFVPFILWPAFAGLYILFSVSARETVAMFMNSLRGELR